MVNIDNLYSIKDNVGKPEQEICKILSEYYGTLVIKCEIIMILIKCQNNLTLSDYFDRLRLSFYR